MPAVFDWAGRLARADQERLRLGLDALVISHLTNIRYLTGFSGTAGLLILSAAGPVFVTDGRYDTSVRDQMSDGVMAVVPVRRVELRYDLTLASLLTGSSRIGFEAAHVTVAGLQRWQAAGGRAGDWVGTEDLVEHHRLIKDEVELDVLRRAGGLLSEVAGHLAEWARAGRTERDVARSIERGLEAAGFERPAFETIVAAGPHSAYPHARPTDRALADGDLVVLDFGGVLDGYCVDLTRVVGIGQITREARSVYDAVRDAQAAAIRTVRGGVKASDVDAAARDCLAAYGFGEAFSHGTGHGLGLDVHEAPRVARAESGVQDILAPGMVCTIEPGAYVPGVGGVRLEDDVVVTAEGCQLLTNAPRDLVVLSSR